MQLREGSICGAGELANDGRRGEVLGLELDSGYVVVQGVGGNLGATLVLVAVAPVLLLAVFGAVGAQFAASIPHRAGVGAARPAA